MNRTIPGTADAHTCDDGALCIISEGWDLWTDVGPALP